MLLYLNLLPITTVVCESLKLFGGGCTFQNNALILTGSFTNNSIEPVLAPSSFQLSLKQINISNNEAQWVPSYPISHYPGEIYPIEVNDQHFVFYILGGFSDKYDLPDTLDVHLQRRQNNDLGKNNDDVSSLEREVFGNTAFFKKKDRIKIGNMVELSNRFADEDVVSASRKFLEVLNDNLRIAAYHDNQLFFLDNLKKPIEFGTPLDTISVYDYSFKKIVYKTIKGDLPTFKAGFSAAQKGSHVYITGGFIDPNPSSDHIYILDLNNLECKVHSVPGLVSSKSGCLFLHHDVLIHSFGMVNNEYSSSTQLIDTKNWKLVNEFNGNKISAVTNIVKNIRENKINEQNKSNDTSNSSANIESSKLSTSNIIIISVSSAFIALLLVTLIIFLIRCRHRYQAKKQLPAYHDKIIWAQPDLARLSIEMDLKIDPKTYLDQTGQKANI